MLKQRLKQTVHSIPFVGSGARRTYRAARRYSFARSYYKAQLRLIPAWAFARTEDTNFFYDLSEENERVLAAFVAAIVGVEVRQTRAYIDELKSDAKLHDHIFTSLLSNPEMQDSKVAYGRRLGWYAFVRVLKPRLVVETGVAQGVGSCVIASALLRNNAEGFPGKYIGTEIDVDAGSLLTGPYGNVGEIIYGDSIESLRGISQEIDIFINDSDHSAEYEAQEYRTVEHLLGRGAIILGDNSHSSPALLEFSASKGRSYLFFAENPKDHWYPGAGIGVSASSIPVKPATR